MSKSSPIQVLSDEEAVAMCKVGPVYAPDGIVERSGQEYRKELEAAQLAGLRKGEAAILEKLADMLKDAERYRWLKANCVLGIKQNGIGWSLNTSQCVAPDGMHQIDAAIDAQILLTLKKSD